MLQLPDPPYTGPWDAVVLRVVDADTFDCRVELPFHVDRRERFRLMDYSAPEKRTPEGKAAIVWINAVMPVGSQVKIKTRWLPSGEDITLGRYVGAFYVRGVEGWYLLGEAEVLAGHAKAGAFEG